MTHEKWGRGGINVGCETDCFVYSLGFLSSVMACESSVLLGTCLVLKVKMKLEAIPQSINQCDWFGDA